MKLKLKSKKKFQSNVWLKSRFHSMITIFELKSEKAKHYELSILVESRKII